MEKPPAILPKNLHQGSATVAKDLDINDMIDKSGCGDVYMILEECLGEYDRDWRRCQSQVKALRRCADSHQKKH